MGNSAEAIGGQGNIMEDNIKVGTCKIWHVATHSSSLDLF
jgi:hypothetical protein